MLPKTNGVTPKVMDTGVLVKEARKRRRGPELGSLASAILQAAHAPAWVFLMLLDTPQYGVMTDFLNFCFLGVSRDGKIWSNYSNSVTVYENSLLKTFEELRGEISLTPDTLV